MTMSNNSYYILQQQQQISNEKEIGKLKLLNAIMGRTNTKKNTRFNKSLLTTWSRPVVRVFSDLRVCSVIKMTILLLDYG